MYFEILFIFILYKKMYLKFQNILIIKFFITQHNSSYFFMVDHMITQDRQLLFRFQSYDIY